MNRTRRRASPSTAAPGMSQRGEQKGTVKRVASQNTKDIMARKSSRSTHRASPRRVTW